MNASPTADISESFLHVSDHTARLSSVDDTTRSLADFRELIQLAQKHDQQRKRDELSSRTVDKKEANLASPGFGRIVGQSSQSTPLAGRNNADVAELFHLLQPFLERYLGEKREKPQRSRLDSVAEDPFTTPKRSPVEPESDSDRHSEIRPDDTFDKPRKSSPAPASSPITTPPMSREKFEETEEATETRSDFGTDDSDMCKYFGGAPQVELADLTAGEIEIESKKPDSARELAELRLQLDLARQQNREMANELGYLRDKLASKKEDTTPISSENVDACFRPYYSKLQLDKVDGLSDVEKSNVIKNLMLSLLVSDFDHLQKMAPRVGDYLRISSRFLDKLHARYYECGEYCPSRYLRDYAVETMDDFQACLDGMMALVVGSEKSE
ncbi:uncharacterized protein CXQ87_001211 [Candidozyma duobushaemuli]|nr:uncharacterized protein CXQ87_001211 [[Candida] duobushaemulonis]PVH18291.1 hypothetical protein CXQ87_001211 [[Candida] duobushaemulonis]